MNPTQPTTPSASPTAEPSPGRQAVPSFTPGTKHRSARRPAVLRFRSSAWLYALYGMVIRQMLNLTTAFVQIWTNKGRALLTTLGIVIAVTSIITVTTFVEGFGSYLTRMLRGFGTQFIIVHPQMPRGFDPLGTRRVTLTLEDMEAVRTECSRVTRISPLVFRKVEVKHGGDTVKEVEFRGVSEHYQTIRNFHADRGRFFSPVDVDTGAYVCVIGRTILSALDADDSIIGNPVYIDGNRFTVIGVLESKGSFLGEDQDQTIMVPWRTALKMYPQQRDLLPFLAQAGSEDSVDEAVAQIARLLRTRHGLAPGQPDDFRIGRQDQALTQFANVRMVATGILAGIVSISLLVGGIGIMNVMLVSVTERTREIGLRKSLGARRLDILTQFLTEAVVLSTAGGAAGVVLGYLIAALANLHPDMVELRVPAWTVALALAFSAGSGIIFGTVPAIKAAIIHPIDALRHE